MFQCTKISKLKNKMFQSGFQYIKKTHLLICIFAIVALVILPVPLNAEWTRLHSGDTSLSSPSTRCEAGLGYDLTTDTVVLFGGHNCDKSSEIYADTWLYSMSQKKWQKIQPNPHPAARFAFVYGSSNRCFYIATGEGFSRTFYDDIWRFHFPAKKWILLPPQAKPSYMSESQWKNNVHERLRQKPAARYAAAGGIFPGGRDFYISLGFSTKRYFDTWKYDTTEHGWTIVDDHDHPYNPSYPHARCLHSGTMVGPNELVIFGGCLSGGGTGGPCPTSDSWVFSNKDKSWSILPDCASPRMKSAMALLPIQSGVRRAIMYGGLEKTSQVLMNVPYKDYEIGVFNPDSKKWNLKRIHDPFIHPGKRHSSVMVTGRHGVFMFGGVNITSKSPKNDLWLLIANSTDMDSLLPASECRLPFFSFISLHGLLMASAWGFFLPWGMFIARYMEHRDPLWFNLHRVFQVFGMLVAIAGFVCAILAVQADHFQFGHGIVGLIVMVLGIQQPLNGCCRPGKPKSDELKSHRRSCWEVWHRISGRLAIIGGIINVSLGVFVGLASMLIWGLWYGYVCLLLLCFVIGEIIKKSRHRVAKRALRRKVRVFSHAARHGFNYKSRKFGPSPAFLFRNHSNWYMVKHSKKENPNVFVNLALDVDKKG